MLASDMTAVNEWIRRSAGNVRAQVTSETVISLSFLSFCKINDGFTKKNKKKEFRHLRSSKEKKTEGCVSHRIKKKHDSILPKVLSTLNFPNLASKVRGKLAAVREQQKPDFTQKQDWVCNFHRKGVLMSKRSL